MATIHISNRALNQSARQAINDVHGDPVWGIAEAVINAFTAMRHMESQHRTVRITLKAGKNQSDTHIVAPGTGITNYEYIENNIGYDTDSEDYIANQKDPDYLNKMGIGIPSIAKLSKEGIAEFRSVSINAKGQEEGLVATYTLQKGGGFIIPAEHPDSKYVFNMDSVQADMKTGVWVRVINSKQYTLQKVVMLLSEIFSRKLNSGYHIEVRETMADEFTIVRPSKDFCSKHQETIGNVHDDKFGDFPVYADIHIANMSEEATVNVLMKKMKIGVFDSEYMAKGYAGCDILDFKPDREGISIDPYNDNYRQYQKIVLDYYEKLGIPKKPTEQMKNFKKEKKWKEKMKQVFLKYYQKNPTHKFLSVDAMPSIDSNIPGRTTGRKVIRPLLRCPKGFHWSEKQKKCIPTLEKPERPTRTEQPTGEEHKRTARPKEKGKRPKITEEFADQSIPDFKILKGHDPTKFCVYISEKESALIFNTYYDWINEVWGKASDDTMDLLSNMAMITAVDDNKGISLEEFLKRLANQL
jgi:hypothetical protein